MDPCLYLVPGPGLQGGPRWASSKSHLTMPSKCQCMKYPNLYRMCMRHHLSQTDNKLIFQEQYLKCSPFIVFLKSSLHLHVVYLSLLFCRILRPTSTPWSMGPALVCGGGERLEPASWVQACVLHSGAVWPSFPHLHHGMTLAPKLCG